MSFPFNILAGLYREKGVLFFGLILIGSYTIRLMCRQAEATSYGSGNSVVNGSMKTKDETMRNSISNVR